MAQIIITAIGSAGDVHPLVGIGAMLSARGHRVVFCTHPPFAALVERQGFEFVPIGSAEDYAAAIANPALWSPRTSFRTLWGVIAPTLRPHFGTLAALTGDDTILVGSLWAFSARMMQEAYRTPFVSVQISPSTLLSAHAPPTHKGLAIPRRLPLALKAGLLSLIETQVLDKTCAPALNAVRREIGLPPAHHILGNWLHSTDGVLCLFPDWFAAPQPDWPSAHFLSGFPLFNEIRNEDSDPDLEAFLAAGERPVVFTAGSTLVDSAAYARVVEETLRLTNRRGILLMPAASEAPPASSKLLTRRYVPMKTLLPRCSALVHHGGIGTAALAFAAGIPQIATPFAHDQFDNAQRIAAIGCGLRIDAPVQSRKLAQALDTVLSEPSFAARCEQIRRQLELSPDGNHAAADYIERFIRPQDSRHPAARPTLQAVSIAHA